MDTNETMQRRRFLVLAGLSAIAIPVVLRWPTEAHAKAKPLPPLPVTNAQAHALNYTEDASLVKAANHKPGSNCANCQFFTPSTGACSLFAGYSVAPKGWCSAWSKSNRPS
ncbi:high-potential iron-sulfur protein [Thermomonas sp.]|uniref:high-potential iron-sulfur protein n=1 Tax=Thermomonas sp. TaxID=1971895 RepID=UPI002489249D|nr:high-potential iron-sulfur protein [Thermomonas sp.]MDI1253802.1 high-potential iron-sulfur protein [Thermomonas sp.]